MVDCSAASPLAEVGVLPGAKPVTVRDPSSDAASAVMTGVVAPSATFRNAPLLCVKAFVTTSCEVAPRLVVAPDAVL